MIMDLFHYNISNYVCNENDLLKREKIPLHAYRNVTICHFYMVYNDKNYWTIFLNL